MWLWKFLEDYNPLRYGSCLFTLCKESDCKTCFLIAFNVIAMNLGAKAVWVIRFSRWMFEKCSSRIQFKILYANNSLQAGAGTMRPDIMSSEMTGGSVGGGGHTSESIMSSVAARITPLSSGGSVRDDLPQSPNCSSATSCCLFHNLQSI